MANDVYQNPLISRYASSEAAKIWSNQKKFSTWRRLWVSLAEAEQQLGLPITDSQLDAMRSNVEQIDFDAAREYERKLRHDVMAHVHAFGDACPEARGIIHLGATSCYVTDNTDLILIRESLELVRRRLVRTIDRLSTFAELHRDLACLGFTHLQPAQPTTIGKRTCLWINDLVMDLTEVEHRLDRLQARSIQGTTGTQASFLKLLDGDHDKVRKLQSLVAEKLGFESSITATGQTYSRKIDSQVLDVLSGVAQSTHKGASDIRIMSHRKEMEEPFEKDQIGSSAMAYKRNPMRSERICSLARFVISLQTSTANTVATQWMERTLDDSANRRLVLPQSFLAIDAILVLFENVATGLVVYPEVIRRGLEAELPFMATENILMAAVAAGGDRQDLHERIRQHSQAAAAQVKEFGRENDLLDRIRSDEAFASVNLSEIMNVREFVGRAPEQVDEYVAQFIAPLRDKYRSDLAGDASAEVTV